MARIKIDLDRAIGTVDPRIFGGFIEHLGRCVYGGIFDEGSPLSDERGFRRDVMDALRPLRMPVLRWPGGNFVSAYHWEDGVGPVDRRPRRFDLAWRVEESNRFGTPEFIEYCRALGTEPYLCINMGTGSLDEAHAWLEYCNSTRDSHYANLRREHGYEEPFNVRLWGLGNEMYGRWQVGALDATDYVKRATEYAKILLWTDPGIELVSCGWNGHSEWDREVIEGLARWVRWHSVHMYTGSEDYYTNVFAPHHAERALEICETLIARARYKQQIEHPIHIAFDEWNVWYHGASAEEEVDDPEKAAHVILEETYRLQDALAVALFLNAFVRRCGSVRMANLAQMVNVLPPIITRPDGLLLTTIYHPLRLCAEHTLPVALDAWVESPTHDLEEVWTDPARKKTVTDLGPFPMLDVAATRDEARRELTLCVINRDRERDHATSIELSGADFADVVRCYEVNGPAPDARNTFATPDIVGVRDGTAPAGGHTLQHTFPAHSVTVLRAPLR